MRRHFCIAHRGICGSWWLPGRLLSFCFHVPLSLRAPSPLTMSLCLCLSFFLFLSLPPLRVSLFLFLGISLCPCYSVSLRLPLRLAVFSPFLFLAALFLSPLSSLLSHPPEPQLPHPKAPWPEEPTQAHLLGNSRCRALPAGSQRQGWGGGSLPLSALWSRGSTTASLLSRGPRTLRCCQPQRKEAAGLDRDNCGRSSPQLRSLATIS